MEFLTAVRNVATAVAHVKPRRALINEECRNVLFGPSRRLLFTGSHEHDSEPRHVGVTDEMLGAI